MFWFGMQSVWVGDERIVYLIVKDMMLSRCGHVWEDHWNDIPQPSDEDWISECLLLGLCECMGCIIGCAWHPKDFLFHVLMNHVSW